MTNEIEMLLSFPRMNLSEYPWLETQIHCVSPFYLHENSFLCFFYLVLLLGSETQTSLDVPANSMVTHSQASWNSHSSSNSLEAGAS